MVDQPPRQHSARYYVIVGLLLVIANVIGFVFIEEASWALILAGCFTGGFVAEGIADLVRHKRSRR
ncbi:hypothetical protein ACVDFE_30965 [Lentzea chajnantorensis]